MIDIRLIHSWETPTEYTACMKSMEEMHELVLTGGSGSCMIITRHNPVKTIGFLDRKIDGFISTNRGGGPTYHDPGQIVFYPILKFDQIQDLIGSSYTQFLQNWVQGALKHLGFQTKVYHEHVGVWVMVDDAPLKVSFIGARIRRNVTLHGFAINLNADLEVFKEFIPCNIDDVKIGNLMIPHEQMIDALLRNCPITCNFI